MLTARSFLALACAAVLVAGCSTPSNQGSSTTTIVPIAAAAPAAEEEVADADPMVCKNMAPTGTRIAKRHCMRKTKWEQAQRDAQDAAAKVQLRGAQQPVPNG